MFDIDNNKFVINIFDFDDTLIYTSEALYQAYKESFKKCVAININKNQWNKCRGNTFDYFCNYLSKDYKILKSKSLRKQIHIYKEIVYKKYFYLTKLNKNFYNYVTNDISHLNFICSLTNRNVIYNLLEFYNLNITQFKILEKSITTKREILFQIIKNLYIDNVDIEKIRYINIFDDNEGNLEIAKTVFKNICIPTVYTLIKKDQFE